MRSYSGLWFPVAVVSATAASVLGLGSGSVDVHHIPDPLPLTDTVIYTRDAYKIGRVGDFGEYKIADSLLAKDVEGAEYDELDTIPKLTARDTIKAPDSLRLIDPFRYKYYVAIIDSLTHAIVSDSLRQRCDSLKVLADTLLSRIPPDSLGAASCLELARLDSMDRHKLDSLYIADSTAVAKAKFDAWYNSLSRKERKAYDAKVALPGKLARMDSLRKVEEDKEAYRDSVIEYTPRILETFALNDTMQYKRIIEWTVDQNFHRLDVQVPDTSYNYHYYDYPFFRKDVNATWLGVPGSPLQYYNYFNRESDERVEFYNVVEPWTWSPRTIPNYNTKTPYTELCYYGTLLAGDAKESDNLHILSTQNILPELNLTLSYDHFGGGGILEKEKTANKTASIRLNYLGKKYMAHAGFIHNTLDRTENGGVADIRWIRDTTVDSREIPIMLNEARSVTKKTTFYLDQQYRIPFEFLKRIGAKRDTTAAAADTLSASMEQVETEEDKAADDDVIETYSPIDRNVTTAFIGHSSEWSSYSRLYTDALSRNGHEIDFYNGVVNFGPASHDSLGVMKLDNKLFVRLQPWGSEAIVSKLDVGVGDELRHYFDSTVVRPQKHIENSVYLYAGAQGSFRKYLSWDATAKFNMMGYKIGDTEVDAGAAFNFYPFRRARTSPISVSARFSSTLLTPDYYQQMLNTNHFSWENDFSKISTTKIRGRIDIPRWKLSAEVGYALIANNIYYDTLGIVRQYDKAMSVLSGTVRKDFAFGPLHLDNRILVQYSSNQDVIPLPTLSVNLRWYLQFDVEPGVMQMQIGANGFYNTKWYSPAWNPAIGVFHNQNVNRYNNGPYFDAFINIQWKRLCMFIKYQNVGRGWPMEHKDYFTADRYIYTTDGMDGLKLGMYWPFYFDTKKHNTVNR